MSTYQRVIRPIWIGSPKPRFYSSTISGMKCILFPMCKYFLYSGYVVRYFIDLCPVSPDQIAQYCTLDLPRADALPRHRGIGIVSFMPTASRIRSANPVRVRKTYRIRGVPLNAAKAVRNRQNNGSGEPIWPTLAVSMASLSSFLSLSSN
jgi:hypothetical protein